MVLLDWQLELPWLILQLLQLLLLLSCAFLLPLFLVLVSLILSVRTIIIIKYINCYSNTLIL